jgi:hypothetical protein
MIPLSELPQQLRDLLFKELDPDQFKKELHNVSEMFDYAMIRALIYHYNVMNFEKYEFID